MEAGKQNQTAQYALIQGIYWMSFCIIFAYASVYLLDRGFSNTGIGLLIGVSGTVSALLQPLIGGIADQNRKLSLKTMILLIGSLMLFAGAALYVVKENQILTVLFYGLEVTFLQVLTPLIYALGMGCVNRGERLNFGLARGIGSLAYAGISYIAGFLVAAAGTSVIPAAMAAAYAALLVAVWWFGRREDSGSGAECSKEHEKANAPTGKGSRQESFFMRYPGFFVLLIGAVLVFVSHNMINNFAYQIMEYKGGGSSAMGTAIALAAASELPTMFLFGWMVKKIRCDIWLKVSGLFFAIKALATVLVSTVGGMYAIQGLQMFGFALFVVASVYYVNAVMEENDRVKGQAYMTMTNTLGAVLGSACGGAVIDGAGIQALLICSAAAAVGGMVLICAAAKRVPCEERA